MNNFVTETELEEIKTQMCDKFCRFPFELDESELESKCNTCPLNRLNVPVSVPDDGKKSRDEKIMELREAGYSYRAIAHKYDLSVERTRQIVSRIKHRRWLKEKYNWFDRRDAVDTRIFNALCRKFHGEFTEEMFMSIDADEFANCVHNLGAASATRIKEIQARLKAKNHQNGFKRPEDICWDHGIYTGTCDCGCCIHQDECSGNDRNGGTEE